MSSVEITVATVAAVLVFWSVGAYNRLMQLRNGILRMFGPLDLQLDLRHSLMQRQIGALELALPEYGEALAALRAACGQAQAAAQRARAQPAAANALNSLRLAEEILLETRARLPAAFAAHAAHADLDTQLAAAEAAMQFARTQFNDAVLKYNQAVQQFPTRMLAGLFGFRPAGAF